MSSNRQGHPNTVWNDLEGTEEIWPYGGSNLSGVRHRKGRKDRAPAEPGAIARRQHLDSDVAEQPALSRYILSLRYHHVQPNIVITLTPPLTADRPKLITLNRGELLTE